MILLWQLFSTFFYIGCFTVGGGFAMIPLIQQEVLAHGWANLSLLTDIIGISQSTPGPFAISVASVIGNISGGGFAGSFFATLGVALPSFAIILLVAKYFHKYMKNQYVQRTMQILRPAVVGLITFAAYTIFSSSFIQMDYHVSQIFNLQGAIILAVLCLLQFIVVKKIHPIAVIGISAAMGVLIFGLIP